MKFTFCYLGSESGYVWFVVFIWKKKKNEITHSFHKLSYLLATCLFNPFPFWIPMTSHGLNFSLIS